MTRFRGALSTQPGCVPYADFELTQEEDVKLEQGQLGPFGDGTEIPIFIQQPVKVSFFENLTLSGQVKQFRFYIALKRTLENNSNEVINISKLVNSFAMMHK